CSPHVCSSELPNAHSLIQAALSTLASQRSVVMVVAEANIVTRWTLDLGNSVTVSMLKAPRSAAPGIMVITVGFTCDNFLLPRFNKGVISRVAISHIPPLMLIAMKAIAKTWAV